MGKKYYAYFVPEENIKGIAESWKECEKAVKGKSNAKFKGFKMREDAEAWLEKGADYDFKKEFEKGIYFDAGTGRGKGVEVSVTNERGKSLLHMILPPEKISGFGTHLLANGATNNYGELLACKFALEIALKTRAEKIFGDSKIVVNYWSKGFVKEVNVLEETLDLIDGVKILRDAFEEKGGAIISVSGSENPADLGFHR